VRLHDPALRERIIEPDLISLVDVVFILIIFFLTTSALVDRMRAKVELPIERGDPAVVEARSPMVINITANGRYIIEEREMTLDAVIRAVRAQVDNQEDDLGLQISVRPDRAASAIHLNQLAEALLEMGVATWRIATEVPRSAAP
jgi:biopolymer transport protein ExbD